MNKLFILTILTALASQANAAAVQVTAPAVTVTAGGPRRAMAARTTAGSAPGPAPGPAPVAAAASSSGSSDSSSSGGSGSLTITKDQFVEAWKKGKQYLPDPNVTEPTDAQFKAFIEHAGPDGGITSNRELAMFMSQIMWESGGLVYKSEIACKTNNCAGSYQDTTGLPGKFYYGRGYIQLTWGANYKGASTDLFNDDRLLQDPDQVAKDEGVAWGVSFWFWKKNVKPVLKDSPNFGLTTKAINGALECSSATPNEKAVKRYKIYTEILKVFEPSETPVEGGCYN